MEIKDLFKGKRTTYLVWVEGVGFVVTILNPTSMDNVLKGGLRLITIMVQYLGIFLGNYLFDCRVIDITHSIYPTQGRLPSVDTIEPETRWGPEYCSYQLWSVTLGGLSCLVRRQYTLRDQGRSQDLFGSNKCSGRKVELSYVV